MLSRNQQLCAITPLDGRYQKQTEHLNHLVSERGLIAKRIQVEAAWLLYLADHPMVSQYLTLGSAERTVLEAYTLDTPMEEIQRVKDIEKETNHDVKAVEYLIREKLTQLQPVKNKKDIISYIHFACTSEDINNLAYGLMLAEVKKEFLLPLQKQLVNEILSLAKDTQDVPMLSRTHGQTATPTTMGKELAVFSYRLKSQRVQLADVALKGKLNGAVGNYNAHIVTFEEINWPEVTRGFIEEKLGLLQNPMTTQIENHDSMIEFCDAMRRFNVILLGFCRDMWGYISLGYFRQTIKEGEVGSSTMPHKVNPIDFENAEGNLGIAIALSQHFSEKLPISRWQRDLSDSTVQRSFGTLLGHTVLAYQAVLKGLQKVKPYLPKIEEDLNQAWEVLAEPIQMMMRKHGIADAYERLKKATRGEVVTQSQLHSLINETNELTDEAKEKLLSLTPSSYIGLASRLVEECQFV